MAARRVVSPLVGPFATKHRNTLIKVRGFPERDQDVEDSEAGNSSAKPIGSDRFLQDGKPCAIGNEDKQIILAPIPEQRVPRRKDEIEPEQQAENYEKNDGQ